LLQTLRSTRYATEGRPRFAVFVLLVAAVTALGYLPATFRSIDAKLRENGTTPLTDRELAGAHGVDISRTYLLAARRLLPRSARYSVLTGPEVHVSTPITLVSVPTYSRFWLLPRREVPVRDADWLLCFGCNDSRLRIRYDVRYREADHLFIARIAR
jgi:hypothetical protein